LTDDELWIPLLSGWRHGGGTKKSCRMNSRK
jgi:hypothetical protein